MSAPTRTLLTSARFALCSARPATRLSHLAPAALAWARLPTALPSRSHSSSSIPRSRLEEAAASGYTVAPLDERTYHAVADRAMERLTEHLEELVEEVGDEAGFEVEYSSGVLTLDLGEHGTYVLNKQPPNKQIWLSSPVSGPKRYDYDPLHKVWFYSRDGELLRDLLSQELAVAFGDGPDKLEIDLGEEDDH